MAKQPQRKSAEEVRDTLLLNTAFTNVPNPEAVAHPFIDIFRETVKRWESTNAEAPYVFELCELSGVRDITFQVLKVIVRSLLTEGRNAEMQCYGIPVEVIDTSPVSAERLREGLLNVFSTLFTSWEDRAYKLLQPDDHLTLVVRTESRRILAKLASCRRCVSTKNLRLFDEVLHTPFIMSPILLNNEVGITPMCYIASIPTGQGPLLKALASVYKVSVETYSQMTSTMRGSPLFFAIRSRGLSGAQTLLKDLRANTMALCSTTEGTPITALALLNKIADNPLFLQGTEPYQKWFYPLNPYTAGNLRMMFKTAATLQTSQHQS